MSDPEIPTAKVSNRISPLAVIVALALVGFVVYAFVKAEGHHTSRTGVQAPIAQSSRNVAEPEQSTVSNTPQPAANTNDSFEAKPDTDHEPGGMAAHSGPANGNTTGGQ